MSRNLTRLILMETDPYFVREFLVLFTCYMMISSFFDPFNSNLGREGQFLISTSTGLFFMPLIYSVVVGGLFARSLEHGSFGFLLTLPIRRNTAVFHYILAAVIAEVALFSIPVVFTDYLAYSTIAFEPLTFIIVSLAAFSFFYVSAGYLLASLSRNSILTVMVILGVFLAMSIYSTSVFPGSLDGQFFFSGLGYFSTQQTVSPSLGYILALVAVLGLLFAILSHFILRIRGVKSGR